MQIDVMAGYLATHLPELGALQHMQRFSDGQSNPTWRLDCAAGSVVLRAQPPGDLLPSAHAVDREFRVLQALAESAVPVPKVLHLCTDRQRPLERMFYIMEHLEGRIFWDPALPDLASETRAAIYDAMNAGLAALHDLDPAEVGLGDYGKPGDYFARQTGRWWRQYCASVEAPSAAMGALHPWLEAHLPASEELRLVHGDFRLDNIIFAPDRPQILGILDWELSTLGHPLAHLAYQVMQWRLPNASDMPGLGGVDRVGLGIPSDQDYVRLYCKRRNISVPEAWPVYIVFSFFRLIAILQGVVARSQQGSGSNPESGQRLARAIPMLETLAMEAMADGAH